MSNHIGIKDIVSRLENDIFTLTEQELYWQAKVIYHNFREKLEFLKLNRSDNENVLAAFEDFISEQERKLNEDTVI